MGWDTTAQTRTQIAHIRKKKQETVERKKAALDAGTNLWKAWQEKRKFDLSKMLSHTDKSGAAIYKYDPSYEGGGVTGFAKHFVGDQTEQLTYSEAGRKHFGQFQEGDYVPGDFELATGSRVQSVTPTTPGAMPLSKEGAEIATEKFIEQNRKLLETDILKEGGKVVGKEVAKEAGKEVAEETAKEVGTSTVGKLAAGIGVGMDLYTLASKDASDEDKIAAGIGVAGTAVGTFFGVPWAGSVASGAYKYFSA